jgi:hypothetical protein
VHVDDRIESNADAALVLRSSRCGVGVASPLWVRASDRTQLTSKIHGRWTSRVGSALVRSLFMRALGGVYLIAFTSLRRQVLGLYGTRGIEPILEYLDLLRRVFARRRERTSRLDQVRLVPTVFWLDASDTALVRACTAGQVGSALLVAGFAPRITAAALWSLYLSFVSVGRDFLSFQWDSLLLETGLAATIVAPPRRRENPSWTAVALMRWLVFRLYFGSGLCKLQSHDPTWRSCTACSYHYTTQPLPTPLGWYAHQLPPRAQRFSTFMTLALELGAPFLTFAPRRLRRAAFAALASLQALIAATGNYGFFNVLTVVDSLWMLDDRSLPQRLRVPTRRAPWWRRLATAVAAVPLVALSISELVTRLRPRTKTPHTLARLRRTLAPFYATNHYGLFAVMTTERPEIVIEGSRDGTEWREYSFRYKPGDVHHRPRFVAPHQPRLDWQMWFAAMQSPPAWFDTFLARLLEGAPDVLALLDGNPFPDGPPTYVRALLYDYRMTDRETRSRTGAWWHRELRGTYVPAAQLASRSAAADRVDQE